MSKLTALGLALSVVAYAWWATGLRPFSWPALVAVEAAGIVAILLGARWPRPSSPHCRPSRRPVMAWAALLAALAGWELAAYLQSPRAEHPTLSSLANVALEPHPIRAAAFVVWLAVAAMLARR